MKILRRLMISAVAVAAMSGIASADEIISFTATVPNTLTDLSNASVTLTAWNPGTGSTASDSTAPSWLLPSTGYQGSVTMASLKTSGITYTLQSYDIYVGSTIVGTYNVTNTAASTGSGLTGHGNVDTETYLSIGSTMASPQTFGTPTNDLYNGFGSDPKSANLNIVNMAPGSSNAQTFTSASGGDYGYTVTNPSATTGSSSYTPITTNLSLVSQASPLQFFVSTQTNISTKYNNGNNSETQTTSVTDAVTVVYDFTTSSTIPEPTTMVLFGSALVGLGLLRKRIRQ